MLYQVLSVCCLFVLADSQFLNEYLTNCPKFGPNSNACIINYLNSVQPYVKSGREELGLNTYDPLVISDLIVSHLSPKLKATATLNNLKFHNFTNYEVVDFSQDETTVIENVKFDDVVMVSDYNVNATLLDIPVIGKGFMQINIPSLHMKNVIDYTTINEAGVKRCKITNIAVNVIVRSVHMHVTGLIGGNATNLFLNANSQIIAEELSHVLSKIFEEYGKKKNAIACKRKPVPISVLFS